MQLRFGKTLMTYRSVLSIHMMAAIFPFLFFLVSSFLIYWPFFLSDISLLLIRLCSSQAKSGESATSTIHHYVGQQQFTVWSNQNEFVLAGSWGQKRSSGQHVRCCSVLLGSFGNSMWTCCPHQCFYRELSNTSLAVDKIWISEELICVME